MLERYFVRPDTIDRIRASWLGVPPPIKNEPISDALMEPPQSCRIFKSGFISPPLNGRARWWTARNFMRRGWELGVCP